MPFLDADEHLIIMDSVNIQRQVLSLDDLHAVKSAGVKTVMLMDEAAWDTVEPTPGARDWSHFDRYVEKVTSLGMKVLLQCYCHPAQHFPDDWYPLTSAGKPLKTCLAPWCPEAEAASLSFTKEMIERYSSPQVEVMCVLPWTGEGCLPEGGGPEAIYGDRIVNACGRAGVYPSWNNGHFQDWLYSQYLHFYEAHQALLCNQPGDEVWTAMHPHLNPEGVIERYVAALSQVGAVHHIYYTWIQWANHWGWMERLQHAHHEQVFGGAEYCEGLPWSVRLVKEKGTRGLVCSPCHEFTHHLCIEPWMQERLAWAVEDLSK